MLFTLFSFLCFNLSFLFSINQTIFLFLFVSLFHSMNKVIFPFILSFLFNSMNQATLSFSFPFFLSFSFSYFLALPSLTQAIFPCLSSLSSFLRIRIFSSISLLSFVFLNLLFVCPGNGLFPMANQGRLKYIFP